MDRTRLTALLEEPGRIAVQDLGALRDLAERHPWFSGAHVLLATGEQVLGDVMSGEHIRDAAAHVPDRRVLFDLSTAPSTDQRATPQLHVVREGEPCIDERVHSSTLPQDPLPAEQPLSAWPKAPLSDAQIAERILEQQMLEAAIATGYSLEALVFEPVPEPAIPETVPAPLGPVSGPIDETIVSLPVVPPLGQTRMRFTDWLDNAPQVTDPAFPFEKGGTGDATDWVRKPVGEKSGKALEMKEPQKTPPPPVATTPSPTLTRDTIDRFLKKAVPEQPQRAEFFTPQEAGRRSLREQADLVTETLARVYEQQGNFTKAAEAYRKLALKVPEKAAYFAALSQAAAEKQKKEG